MRVLSLCILALTLLTGAIARAEETEDYSHALKTYQGTLGSDLVVAEFAFARTPEGISGRFNYLSDGKDIPLSSSDETTELKSAGSELTFIEEAPCTPKTCQSIVPERDDEFGDLAPGEAPKAAEWRIKIDENGKTISGTRKDLKTLDTKPVSLSFVGSFNVEYDCCSTYQMFNSVFSIDTVPTDLPYDLIKVSVPHKSGPTKTIGKASYHMTTDERIGADFPVLDRLPGGMDVSNANDWLLKARVGLYVDDFNCASRTYHGFRWNKALSKKLKNYKTKSKAEIDFISDKLIGIGETINVDCGESWPKNSKAYVLGDVKTGKTVDPKTLIAGLEYLETDGTPTEPKGAGAQQEFLIDKIKDAISNTGDDSSLECLDENTSKDLTVAFRGKNLAFMLSEISPDNPCYDDILTVPLSEAGDYLNDQGKAYFAEFLK